MLALMGFAVIVGLVVFATYLMRPPVPPHRHGVADHRHPGVDSRLDAIESVIRIDRAAGAAELQMFDEIARRLRHGGNGIR